MEDPSDIFPNDQSSFLKHRQAEIAKRIQNKRKSQEAPANDEEVTTLESTPPKKAAGVSERAERAAKKQKFALAANHSKIGTELGSSRTSAKLEQDAVQAAVEEPEDSSEIELDCQIPTTEPGYQHRADKLPISSS